MTAEFGFLRARAGGNGRAQRDDGVCLRRLRDRDGTVKRRVRRQDHFRPWRAAESRMEPVPRLPDDGLPAHIKTQSQVLRSSEPAAIFHALLRDLTPERRIIPAAEGLEV